MTDELKPVRCGCGGEALPCYCDIFGTKYWSVTCQECLTHTDRFDTEAEAVTAWNRAMGERTVKATRKPEAFFYRCECGYGLCCEKNDINYCPQCGARLEWE